MDAAHDLEALAKRVEAAAGPDRDIDGWIHATLNPEQMTVVGEKPGRFPRDPIYGPLSEVMEKIGGVDGAQYISAPLYTASIDAAMTLVPEGCVWSVMTDYELPGRARVYGWPTGAGEGPPILIGYGPHCDAANPALALCAASLRALSQGVNDDHA